MKHIFKVTLFVAGILASAQGRAQSHTDGADHKISKTTNKVVHKTGETATAVGHKTSEIAAKGAATITDKRYEGKVARGGQTVYINEHSHYYYINKTGHRIYVNKSSLRDKPSA